MRKLLLATEAHKKREAQKARRQQVKAALLQAQAEELVCSRLLRATRSAGSSPKMGHEV